ncbi:hypothetical protein JTE90_017450 [Oedothorax gibbosus]|uniref:Ig-like domain-containing protein n=1 Tax=Oedothorax gibbosus TaxID=931172 RepID=A0AAV6U0W8_9ARAC|nr:hypothetical protein JTE90_017450 [Oedothorax gibbosus]
MQAIVYPVIVLWCWKSWYLVDAANQEAPKIQKFQFPEKLEVNEKVGVTCMLRAGQPPYVFQWYKNGKELKVAPGTSLQTAELVSVLYIDPVTYTSAGNYTCTVKNAGGIDSYTAYLTVTAPPTWKNEPKDVEIILNEPISITCSADGFPEPKISWIKNGDNSFFERRSESFRNMTLSFRESHTGDKGEYTCYADNGVGEALTKKINIVIHASSLTRVLSNDEQPKIQHLQVPSMLEMGEKMSIPCMIRKGLPPFKFEWYKNSDLLESNKNLEIQDYDDSSKITINPVTEKSPGNYTCIVRNKHGFDSLSTFFNVKAPATWSKEPQDIETIEGESVILQCAADGSPVPRVSWKPLGSTVNQFLDTSSSSNGTLRFKPVSKLQEGSYECIAENDVGSPLRKIISLVVHEPPKIQPFQFPPNLQVGYKASVTCMIMQGGEPFSYQWYKNGKSLKESSYVNIQSNEKLSNLVLDPIENYSTGNYTCVVSSPYGSDNYTTILTVRDGIDGKFSSSVGNGSLVFDPILKDHEGTYSCEADNGVGNPIKKITSIVVHEKPAIQPFQFPMQIKRGDTASITCALMRGSVPVKFHWLKNGKEVGKTTTITVISSSELSNLVIKPVDENSAGNFTCVVKSKDGEDSYTATLGVKAPPSWIEEPKDFEVVEGHPVTFSCIGSGSPLPTVTWKRQGEASDASTVYHTANNGILTLNPTTKDHEGYYECEIENGIGEKLRKKVQLTVYGMKIN